MSKVKLYPNVKIAGQSFKGAKVHTVPSQSLSLKEILKRFVRREQLPIEKQGVYTTRFGDLEKLAVDDITVQMDRAKEMREYIAKAEKRMKDAEEARINAEIKRKAEEQAARDLAAKKEKPDSPAIV